MAEKAAFFAQYIGYDSINVQKIYLAGALHDIGTVSYTHLDVYKRQIRENNVWGICVIPLCK